jgi:phosphatidylglycerophosphate synthase
MLDRHVHSILDRPLATLAAAALRRGLTADRVTVAGLAAGLLAVPFLAAQSYVAALVCILLNRLLDGLDGAMARQTRASDRGAFLDVAFDFFFYGAVPFGFALAEPAENGLPASFLLLSFIGTGSSFLALASLAAKRGLTAEKFPAKGIYYVGGIAEGTETIACFVLMCLLPAHFPLLAFAFGALCFATTALRWVWGWRLLSRDFSGRSGNI